jgi:hypothetical protein
VVALAEAQASDTAGVAEAAAADLVLVAGLDLQVLQVSRLSRASSQAMTMTSLQSLPVSDRKSIHSNDPYIAQGGHLSALFHFRAVNSLRRNLPSKSTALSANGCSIQREELDF